MNRATWARVLVVVGLLGMLAGALDPLEGSVIILPGVGLAALGAFIAQRRYRKLLGVAFALAAVGIGALFAMSALGGVGGDSGRSMLWAFVILPYPAGWVMGIVGAILWLVRNQPAMPDASQARP
jgi:hypothetical protein